MMKDFIKNNYLNILLVCLFLIKINIAYTLPIDEKLTLRIMKISASKKTILINRGIEDGLVVGDHAKFFLTIGVISRGVLVKASPSRSIWSLYRLVYPDYLKLNQVMNLKISSPVKLTEDETKALQRKEFEPSDSPKPTDPPVDEKMKDLSENSIANAQVINNNEILEIDVSKDNWDIFTSLNFSSLGVSTLSSSNESTTGTDSSFSLNIGLERYFIDQSSWYSSFSIVPFIHYSSGELQSTSSSSVSSNSFEYGIGANWYFWDNPNLVNKFIYYVPVTIGLGTVSESSTETVSGNTDSSSLSGNSNFFSLGLGAKYLVSSGIGLRATVDYYMKNELYADDQTGDNYTKSKGGLRFLIGLSYRF